MGNPRRANGTRRNALRARLRAEGRPCWICRLAGKSGRIDYDLPAGHPYSFEVDELVPVSKYWLGGYPSAEAAALDYNNLAAAHRCCNQWRSNKTVDEVRRIVQGRKGGKVPPRLVEVHPSRDWRHFKPGQHNTSRDWSKPRESPR